MGAGAGPDMGGASDNNEGGSSGASGFNKGNADDVEYEVKDEK
jgi:molecular chaperone DnaK